MNYNKRDLSMKVVYDLTLIIEFVQHIITFRRLNTFVLFNIVLIFLSCESGTIVHCDCKDYNEAEVDIYISDLNRLLKNNNQNIEISKQSFENILINCQEYAYIINPASTEIYSHKIAKNGEYVISYRCKEEKNIKLLISDTVMLVDHATIGVSDIELGPVIEENLCLINCLYKQ